MNSLVNFTNLIDTSTLNKSKHLLINIHIACHIDVDAQKSCKYQNHSRNDSQIIWNILFKTRDKRYQRDSY